MSGAATDEASIVARLVDGDRAAFELVYRKHNSALIGVAIGIVRIRATAEEVVQDTWVAVWTGIGTFEGRSSLAGWIFSILVNKARTRAKRDGRTVHLDGTGEANGLEGAFDGRGNWKVRPEIWDMVTPERQMDGRSTLDLVQRAIDALPPAQKAVLVMRGQQEIEGPEVCRILGISDGNMRLLLHRARVAVRNALDASDVHQVDHPAGPGPS